MREYASSKDGAAKAAAPFKLDGVEFHAAVSFLDILPLADFASIEFDKDGQLPPAAATSLVEFFKAALGDDYERFAKHVRTNRTDVMVLLQIMMDVMEDAGAGMFPTVPSSPSAGGGGATVSLSPDGWSETLAGLSEQERQQVMAVTQLAHMRHQAAAQFNTTLPPLPPGVVPQDVRPEVAAILQAVLSDPQAAAVVQAAIPPPHPSLPL